MTERAWGVEFYRDERGNRPVEEFILAQSPPERAKVIRSLEALAELAQHQLPHTITRPKVETMRGAIKEVRIGRQMRVLFSWEKEQRLLLVLDAERKKVDRVTPALIDRAERYRTDWLRSKRSDRLSEVKEEWE